MKQKEAEKTKQRKLLMVSHLQKDFISIPRGPSKGKKNLLLPCLLVKLWLLRVWSGSGFLKICVRRIHHSCCIHFFLAGGIG